MRGTLLNTTIGDYLVNQTGFLTSVDYSWQTDYPWEVKLGGTEEDDVQQVPHLLDCTLAFTPIHKFAAQVGDLPYFTNPNESKFLHNMSMSEANLGGSAEALSPAALKINAMANQKPPSIELPVFPAPKKGGFNSVLDNKFKIGAGLPTELKTNIGG